MTTPLIIYAIEQHVDYVGSFVESLWVSEELAKEEMQRMEKKFPNLKGILSVEPWELKDVMND